MKLSYFLIVGSFVSTLDSAVRASPPEPLAPVVVSTPPDRIPAAPPAPRRTGMMVTGIVLTSFASVAFLGGAGLTIANFASPRSDAGPLAAIIGIPLMVGSVLFAAPGIPLWVVGAGARAPKHEAPSLSIGAGSAALRWRF
jgi:hypothetical protein